jgi:hypothetical protein
MYTDLEVKPIAESLEQTHLVPVPDRPMGSAAAVTFGGGAEKSPGVSPVAVGGRTERQRRVRREVQEPAGLVNDPVGRP